jgi:nucleotide-binding universal stress UspA family protein
MFKHILLPTDGSPLSEVAIRQGIQFAKSIGAKVTGLCAMPKEHAFSCDMGIPAEVLELVAKQCRAQADASLAVIDKAAKEAGVSCGLVYETNDCPHEAIIQVADQRGCDLIMMASHGRRGVAALLIGSETQKVLTHSKIPVLVYR